MVEVGDDGVRTSSDWIIANSHRSREFVHLVMQSQKNAYC